MAQIGSLYLGGSERTGTSSFICGIAFSLNQAPKFDYVFTSVDANWEVEIKANEDHIVARSRKPLNLENLISSGFEQIQICLDIIAVKKLGILLLENPERSYVALFTKDDRSILRHYALMNISMGISAQVEIRDKDGNIKPQPSAPEPVWTWAFRYYRLSQASNDIFEAYRNLFLSFEALLNKLYPKDNNEREVDWLKRCLTSIAGDISLETCVPEGTEDKVAYIIQQQYKKIRCKLLHAKHPDALLPHAQINPTDVLAAYEALLRLWQHIAAKKFFISLGGGVITYGGFRLMMDNAFSKGITFYFIEDSSPTKSEDREISPLRKQVIQFDNSEYLGQSRPGFVALQGRIRVTNKFDKMPIYRICSTRDDILYTVSHISSALIPIGVDDLETMHEIRLINEGQPKTYF